MKMHMAYRKFWLIPGAILILAVIGCCITIGIWQSGPKLPKLRTAPTFSLPNIQGSPVGLSDSAGKVRLIEFFFANCPDICPATTMNMVTMQNHLSESGIFGNQVEFLSITFDPERDTPEALTAYAKQIGINQGPGWQLLRGTEQETQQIANNFGIMVVKQKDGQFAHSIKSLFLIDGEGVIRQVFDMGTTMDTTEIEKSIKKLVKSL
ncbi:SCO family protein [Paenibacillus whitsoniae]|nr:SCO family protein [Paenibacillus whitsoniae]